MSSHCLRDRQYTMPQCTRRRPRCSTKRSAMVLAMSDTQFFTFFTTSYLQSHESDAHSMSRWARHGQTVENVPLLIATQNMMHFW